LLALFHGGDEDEAFEGAKILAEALEKVTNGSQL
jgi:hypothetical protein